MSDKIDGTGNAGGITGQGGAVDEIGQFLLQRIRSITANPSVPRNNWLCINELTDEHLLEAWALHGKGVSANQIARTCNVDWGKCLKFSPKQIAAAFMKLFNRMKRLSDIGTIELEKTQAEVTKERGRLDKLKKQTDLIKKQIEEQFDPLVEMASLAIVQRARLDRILAEEEKSKEKDPRVEVAIEKLTRTIKEVANIADLMGMYKGSRDGTQQSATNLHLHLEQHLVNPPAIKGVAKNFLKELEGMVTATINADGQLSQLPQGAAIDTDSARPIDITPERAATGS